MSYVFLEQENQTSDMNGLGPDGKPTGAKA
jgi:hypothetical protein